MPPAVPSRQAFWPFEGKHAQDTAKDAARAAGVALPLVVSLDRTTFYAFDVAEARGEFMLARAGSCELFEKVERATPSAPSWTSTPRAPPQRASTRIESRRSAPQW